MSNSPDAARPRALVLVAHDDPAALDALTRLLEREDFEVVAATDPDRAFELARTRRPDVIVVSDPATPPTPHVPQKLHERLREDESTASLPVLRLLGESAREEAVQSKSPPERAGLKSDSGDYLLTPFRDGELLVKVARLAERRRVEEELLLTVQREALINRITSAVRGSLDPQEIFSTAVAELGRHLNVDRCVLFMLDEAAGVARNVAEYTAEGVKPAGREYSIPIIARLVETIRARGVIAFEDVANDEGARDVYERILRDLGTRSIMYAAITVGDVTPGTFALSTTREVRRWRESDVALARAVADQTGIAIRQAELFEMVARGKQAWESTFDAMSDGIFIFDNARRLARVNRAGAALDGVSPQELLGRNCCDVLRRGGEQEGEGCVVESALAKGRAVTVEYTPERLHRALLVTAEPVHDEGGRVSGAVCTVRDLSELRKAERVARERQSLLENVLESASESIYALDREGHFQWGNKASFASSGYTKEQLIGHHFLEATYEPDRAAVAGHFARALGGEPQSYEMRYTTADGATRYALVNNAPLVIDGEITGVLGIARDITVRKQEIERAAQADKLRALGQLASGVAHDFNNALAAILGRAQLLRRTMTDPAQTHSLDVIQKAAEDAAATVRRIRTFARQSPGEGFAPLDVSELLRDAVEITRTTWENEARSRGIRYDVRLDAAPGLDAEGSASDLREVFVNLIVNALDAMPAGGELWVRAARGDDGCVRIFFADTGAGMAEEVRERIFEPFYTTKGAQGGTGLGLFVSYGIVERHGGRMSVESEPGRGATFTVDLPCDGSAGGAEEAAGKTDAHGDGVGVEGQKLSVLVVDDDEVVRETLVEVIEALGHAVEAAGDGRAALELLAERSFDLVFTDLAMPGMDGWEIAREVRRRFAQTRVIVVTGYGKEALSPGADKGLVDGVIGKPFDFEQVADVIKRVTR